MGYTYNGYDAEGHTRWRKQGIYDMKIFVIWIAIIAAILWIGTSTRAIGAPTAVGGGSAARSAPAPAHTPARIWLTEGSSGAQVREAQEILAHHQWTIAVDGAFGPQTQVVVTNFQKVSGLLPDGIIGPVTWEALQSVAPPPASRLDNATQVTPTVIPAPVPGDCESYRPRIESRGIIPFDWFKATAWRESRCGLAVHARDSDDHSHGELQVNILSRNMREWLAEYGYDHSVLHTTEGGLQAAEAMYEKCGQVPWTPPYRPGCGGELTRYQGGGA